MFMTPFSQRVIAGTTATVGWQQIDGTGEPADPGTVTANVTRADGTVLVTGGATSGSATSERTYGLSVAQTAILDRLTVDWVVSGVTVATTEVDVVAAPWFSNAELRAAWPSVANASSFPPATVALARLQAEWFFERVTHRRFVPGYTFRTVRGASGRELVLPNVDIRRVRSAALFDDPSATAVESLAAGELAAIPPSGSGVISRYVNTWSAPWVKIGYEHGLVAPPPDVKRAALRLCREMLETGKTTSPDAAVSWNSTDLGWSAVFVTPGVRGAHTSLPAVNEVLDAWTFSEIGIA